MSTTTPDRAYLIEGILEIGRNWAFAVSLASLGAATYYTDFVSGPAQWNRWVFWSCLAVSATWFFLAGMRFDIGLRRHYPSKLTHRITYFLTPLLIAGGIMLVIVVAKITDNRHIVAICEDAQSDALSPINGANECKRLRAHRAEAKAELERKLRAQHQP